MGVSSGDRGGHFKGLNAKLYLHLFHDNLLISLFNDAVSILRVKAENVQMITK
jgi:hypothetical protein